MAHESLNTIEDGKIVMETFLYRFSKVWLGLAILVNILALIGKVSASASLWEALAGAMAWFNPGNTRNFITEVVLFSPAVGAYLLAERVGGRSAGRLDIRKDA